MCRYSAAGDILSLDKETEDNGDIYPDPAGGIEDILFDKDLLRELFRALNELDPESRSLCELIRLGKTEREMAAEYNITQPALNYRKQKLMTKLRKRLKEFI
jgi:DNA-directed RNA polymerase specialized sigma24 family protein